MFVFIVFDFVVFSLCISCNIFFVVEEFFLFYNYIFFNKLFMDIFVIFDVVKCICNISNVFLFCVIFKEIIIFL